MNVSSFFKKNYVYLILLVFNCNFLFEVEFYKDINGFTHLESQNVNLILKVICKIKILKQKGPFFFFFPGARDTVFLIQGIQIIFGLIWYSLVKLVMSAQSHNLRIFWVCIGCNRQHSYFTDPFSSGLLSSHFKFIGKGNYILFLLIYL